MNEDIQGYLLELINPATDQVRELEEYAHFHNVPIMESTAIDFLLKQIMIHQPKRILEIGTAIGYSAIRMLEASPEAEIITIERDKQRYEEAVRFIKESQKSEQVDVRFGDALEVLEELQQDKESFDFIFIDAAKGKYRDFFDLAHPLLQKGGWLVTDNVLFRGYVKDEETAPKRYRNMVKKIRAYNQFLSAHPEYITSILPIGDGVMISYKKD
ncbi:putative O-methyltransferase YrrM [Oceanobacillus indicireducens]|uniref:tRNA 5-hydroxyuridine methyltransferase n=2 Tax=Oceanobacillus indicireducens TaxID=1004261 RepID=A0A917XV07_9BACI|nr:putative O-methyltransferase YrrM [Oceanobacillus indicireducens]